MVIDQASWLAKFARLRIDTASKAPHKPLLLLVVLDLAHEGALGPEILPLTPQLAFRFCTYWSIVAHRRNQKPDVRFPFTKLKTEGVWAPLDAQGEITRDPELACSARLKADSMAADASYLPEDDSPHEHRRHLFKPAAWNPDIGGGCRGQLSNGRSRGPSNTGGATSPGIFLPKGAGSP